jgi:hypothetical protein
MRSFDCRLSYLSMPQFVFGPMGSGKSVLLQRLSQEQEFSIYIGMRSTAGNSQATVQGGSPPQESFSESLTKLGLQLGMPRRSHLGMELEQVYLIYSSYLDKVEKQKQDVIFSLVYLDCQSILMPLLGRLLRLLMLPSIHY